MSPRQKEQNEIIREQKRIQILEAALTTYIACGYNGADMDRVAEAAGLSKGLMYYYFKTKQILFRELFIWMFGKLMTLNDSLLARSAEKDPLEQLVYFIWDILVMAEQDARIIRFAMRLPFDAYAVFGPDEWQTGIARANLFQNSLAGLIQKLIESKALTGLNPSQAAANIWAVVVVNAFSITKMSGGVSAANRVSTRIAKEEQLKSILSFCLRGLGLQDSSWEKYYRDIIGVDDSYDFRGIGEKIGGMDNACI